MVDKLHQDKFHYRNHLESLFLLALINNTAVKQLLGCHCRFEFVRMSTFDFWMEFLHRAKLAKILVTLFDIGEQYRKFVCNIDVACHHWKIKPLFHQEKFGIIYLL